ncbi:pore-forming ESAT-6 family protein [Cohnella panacarvi]|uniref:pore-forming ESAT-6 family protein n=1 Tax=Cohnella panacarvi TaxID=400776 RepID=UPI00047B494C|nr:pore-forming ESAT-6 family protein [Cohnella panacarvi]
MATTGINISLGKLTSTAEQITTLNKNLTDQLEEIRKEVKNLSNSWQSDAATELSRDFESYAPKFEEYREVVKSYATFLMNTAEAYDKTETHIKNNADLFK